MASKKNRSRKSLAVALAIVGVAGLSMASAAQLNITNDAVAAGVSVSAACDDAVAVSYGTAFSGGAYVVNQVNVTGIAALCEDEVLDFTLLDGLGNVLATGISITLDDSGSASQGVSVSAALLAQIAIVIH